MKNLNILFVLIGLLFSSSSMAQTERTVVVEHFTNTRCGICASRNPAFKENVANHPKVLSITIHPSRLYNSCELHKHNSGDNDSRTNYYDILGGTPRIVIQGNVISASANYGSSAIFNPYEEKTSPYDLKVEILKKTKDSLTARVVLEKVDEDVRNSLYLYMPGVEDTLNFSVPNGENVHYNVLRESLYNAVITSPSQVGDSVEIIVRTAMHSEWKADQISLIAIV